MIELNPVGRLSKVHFLPRRRNAVVRERVTRDNTKDSKVVHLYFF